MNTNPTTDQAAADRRERYAEALRESGIYDTEERIWRSLSTKWVEEITTAVLAVADAELRRERDLAIAHDRQPYPTAWAYEQVCKTLHRKEAAIDRVRALHQPDANGECQGCDRSFDPCPTIAALNGTVEARQQPDTETLAAALGGLHTLIATSSRDWQTYRVDAWLWAVLCGWDCEQDEHDDTCTHGALEETAAMHGWDADTVAKARRYRAAVRALTEPAAATQPGKEA